MLSLLPLLLLACMHRPMITEWGQVCLEGPEWERTRRLTREEVRHMLEAQLERATGMETCVWSESSGTATIDIRVHRGEVVAARATATAHPLADGLREQARQWTSRHPISAAGRMTYALPSMEPLRFSLRP